MRTVTLTRDEFEDFYARSLALTFGVVVFSGWLWYLGVPGVKQFFADREARSARFEDSQSQNHRETVRDAIRVPVAGLMPDTRPAPAGCLQGEGEAAWSLPGINPMAKDHGSRTHAGDGSGLLSRSVLVLWANQAASLCGVKPSLYRKVIRRESQWDPLAVSPVGAISLAQIMPSTAAEFGMDPFDIRDNLVTGACYLRRCLDRFGSEEKALHCYHAGAGAVMRGEVKEVTRQYARSIINGGM